MMNIDSESMPLASRISRLLAVVIDGLVATPIFLALTSTVFQHLDPFKWSPFNSGVEPPQSVLAGQLVLSWLIFLAINVYLLQTQGQTIGKKLLGLRIVRTNGERASLMRLVGLRYLPFWILPLIPYLNWIGVINVLMIFRESRKCLHDDVADTIVVKT